MPRVFHWMTAHWNLIAPLILGALSLIFLMPRVRKDRSARLGVILGGLAFAWAIYGVFRLSDPESYFFNLLFVLFSLICVSCAVAMITHRNPVYSALFFALVILSACGLFLLQSASFLAAATIIVYAGAVIVTFLFITMLAQQSGLADYDQRSREPVLAVIGGMILIGSLFCAIQANFNKDERLLAVEQSLGKAVALTDPSRVVLSFSEVKEALLLEDSQHVQLAMKTALNRLTAWPNRDETDQKLENLWDEVFKSMAARKMPETRYGLTQIHTMVRHIIQAEIDHGGMIAPSATMKVAMSRLSKRDHDNYVASLGRTLFGDYLYAVEQAGTLLLVATIAAILIAGRHRREVAR